ncbi:ImmA/IrrE family metallo-endopeptidase [Peptococcaceae bacterium]|nr:ImmA/IrrE family metallo-endopeptidase [Peptococcaceae bacterium]
MCWIIREVYILIKKYNTTDPFELADYLDYLVIKYPFRRLNGMLLVVDGIACIGVNSELPDRLQGLVLLHEISHRILHPEMNYFMVLEKTYLPLGKFEYQANRFVAELVLRERQPRYGETIYEFAARHEVPVELVEVWVR